MNKLQKHLLPYLPYGLKFKGRFKGWVSFSEDIMILCAVDLAPGKFDEIKPIFHHLSDLTFEDLDNLGNRYDVQSDPTNKDDRPFVFRTSDNSIDPREWRYDDIEYLRSRHFAIDMPEGTWIDINTLNK